MLTYNLIPASLLNQATYKTQNTPSVSLVELTSDYIKLKKFIPKSTTYTKCRFHFVDKFAPIQLKENALPFTYFEHIWNVSAILSWNNKGILKSLGLPFSIHNVSDIFPKIVDTIVEYKILENQEVKLFSVKDLQFKVTIVYDENNTYDITFCEIDEEYKPYLISDLPRYLWADLLEKYDDTIEIVGDIEIKYDEHNSYYLEFKITYQDQTITEQYYPEK